MKKLLKEEIIAIFLFAAVFIYMFFVHPIVSVADNGDFERVMVSAGLSKFSGMFYDTAQIKYTAVHNIFGCNGYLTTHALCVYIAKIFNIIFYSRRVFDVRCVALLYIAAVLFGIYHIVKALKTDNRFINFCLIALLWLMLCDSGYTPYLNSLYGEGCSYSFLIMLIGISLKLITESPTKKDIFLFFFALTMFFGSKLQYTLLCPIALLLIIPLYKNQKLTKKALTIGLSVLIFINGLIYAVSPKQLTTDTLYQSVFYGILRNSDDIHKDAESIGLDSKYEYLANTTAYDDTPYTAGDPEFAEAFQKKIGRGTVIKYYLTHIPRLWEKMDISTTQAFDNLLGMFSNYTAEDGIGKNSFFTLYNSIKKAVFPESFLTLCIIYVIFLSAAMCGIYKNKKNLYIWLLLTVAVTGIFQFPLPIIGNGEADISKQLYIFNLTFDIMILASIYFILKKVVLNFTKRTVRITQ